MEGMRSLLQAVEANTRHWMAEPFTEPGPSLALLIAGRTGGNRGSGGRKGGETADGSYEHGRRRQADDFRGDASNGQSLPESLAMAAQDGEVRVGGRGQLEKAYGRLSLDHALFDAHAFGSIDLLTDGIQYILGGDALGERKPAMPIAGYVDEVKDIAIRQPPCARLGTGNTGRRKIDRRDDSAR